ncbi:MAG: DMT family transporter [Flavobacterium sp.]|jgi:drug/metabolite transporter (DMT)-like permease|uniref:DMT family transporter n=1 Tax=Flavobacterium sp. TaxID=239 RepID=UPI001B63B73C|nr:DMT family transporter [Flavobacterium sp.]MBP6145671.1 DMT family transporter [Flavobacterium sp.]MBP7181900.1 DMT family transporter [Flavobacterium sp.]MBP7317912.1 DMT family transporter [Flavobacterium sp.]HRL71283.1 DMT family transporter [Flavobacterium sp.]HRM45341.1 DMT family transporter [Flavobacterium sp.]
MTNAKPKLALAIGIICISVFPILVKLQLTGGLISAFYRMAIAGALLLPYVIVTKKFKLPRASILILAVLCGLLFASDVAVWNISIQESSATQASLLTNLSPVWVGIASFLFLKNKPATNFWIGTVIAVFGMITLVGFEFFLNLDFNAAFLLAILSGVLYAIYMLVSKNVLSEMDVLSFMMVTLITSTLFLGVVCLALNEPFSGFSNAGWLVLFIQGIVCQLIAWLLISYATQNMRATRVSLSLLGQAVLATILAWLLLDEKITFQMIVGGLILLLGIRITFYSKTISLRNIVNKD